MHPGGRRLIPPKDYDFLKKSKVSAIFGPGTKAVTEILSLIQKRRLAPSPR